MTDRPGFELAVTGVMAAPIAAVWRAWTEHLPEWWCPAPWTVEVIENDLRAGGRSAMIMHGPGGEAEAMEGVFLEVTPPSRIVFTNAFTAGWIPQAPFMIGFFEWSEEEEGHTRYRHGARHWSEEAMRQHEAMGFHPGWSIVARQLEAVAQRLA